MPQRKTSTCETAKHESPLPRIVWCQQWCQAEAKRCQLWCHQVLIVWVKFASICSEATPRRGEWVVGVRVERVWSWATEGVVFLNQYVSSPVCTPSRYSVLTGTYASRSPSFARPAARGEQLNITWNSHIDETTPNIARTLQKAGYFTGAVGKNHVIKLRSQKRNAEAPADHADPRDAAYALPSRGRPGRDLRRCH